MTPNSKEALQALFTVKGIRFSDADLKRLNTTIERVLAGEFPLFDKTEKMMQFVSDAPTPRLQNDKAFTQRKMGFLLRCAIENALLEFVMKKNMSALQQREMQAALTRLRALRMELEYQEMGDLEDEEWFRQEEERLLAFYQQLNGVYHGLLAEMGEYDDRLKKLAEERTNLLNQKQVLRQNFINEGAEAFQKEIDDSLAEEWPDKEKPKIQKDRLIEVYDLYGELYEEERRIQNEESAINADVEAFENWFREQQEQQQQDNYPQQNVVALKAKLQENVEYQDKVKLKNEHSEKSQKFNIDKVDKVVAYWKSALPSASAKQIEKVDGMFQIKLAPQRENRVKLADNEHETKLTTERKEKREADLAMAKEVMDARSNNLNKKDIQIINKAAQSQQTTEAVQQKYVNLTSTSQKLIAAQSDSTRNLQLLDDALPPAKPRAAKSPQPPAGNKLNPNG